MGRKIGKETRTAYGDGDKFISATGAALSDPVAWSQAFTTYGGSLLKSGKDAWDELSDAEKEEEIAKQDAEIAAREEVKLVEEQQTAQAEQDRMTSERAKESETQARERAKRIGSGRRGLLYQGKATGVTKSTVLGG